MSSNKREVVTFTYDKLAKLEPNKDGTELIVRCDGFEQLAFIVSVKGKRQFSLLTKRGGKQRHKLTNFYPGIDIELVKKQGIAVLNELLAGIDPKKNKTDENLTLSQTFSRWKEDSEARQKRTIARAEYNFNKYLAPLHNKKLADISTDDVASLANRLASGKKPKFPTANRALELVSRMFNFARKRCNYKGDNPALHIERFPEQPSDKFMTEEQFKKFIETAKKEEWTDHKHILLLLAYTAVRLSNAVKARFDEFDLEAKTWRISALKSKNGVEMVLPLNGPALEIVKARRELVKGDYLFGTKAFNKAEKFTWVFKAMKKVCKKSNIGPWPIHSLRKSFGAFALNTLKLPLYEVSKLLCHSNTKITEKHYAKLENKTLSASSDAIANALG